MENLNYSKNIEKAKELLNKILNEKLNSRITNLEVNNKQEFSILSTLSNSSRNITNNLIEYSKKIQIKEKKEINVPKLKLDEINNHNKKRSDINGILKSTKLKYRRNREKVFSSLFDCEASKTKVSFWQKDLNETPDLIIKHKPIIYRIGDNKGESKMNKTFIKLDSNNNFTNQKKKKNRIKNMKCLTERSNKDILKTPQRLLKLSKKICKNTSNYNTINNNELPSNFPHSFKKENKTKKNGNKTNSNHNDKKIKNLEDIGKSQTPRFNYNPKTPENIKVQNEIKKHERNLKSLCESMLIDVNKDELLVNDKIIFSGNITEFPYKSDEKNSKKFQDNFKTCIQYFLKFLSFGELFVLCKTKKEILKIILNLLINQTEKSIDSINSIIKIYNVNNSKDLITTKKLKPFELNLSSQKAISLLNSISKINFIKSIKSCNTGKNTNIKKIILIFDIYFISIGKKNALNNLNSDNNKKIEYICNYFKNNKTKLIGNIIENDLKIKKFDDLIINNLYEYSKEYIDIINPNYYKKINKDIAIFVFVIKNILDFVGISFINNKEENKNIEQKVINIHKSRLNAKNIILDKFNQILNKFD